MAMGQKLVVIRDVKTSVNVGAISEAIDRHAYFCTGALPGEAPVTEQSAWHACRVHHRGRVLRAPEAACEHLGSLAHQVWDPSQGLSPAPLIQRVHLMSCQVRCVGGERDEMIISEVARILRNAGKNPLRRRPGLQQITDIREALVQSGRHATGVIGSDSEEDEAGILRPSTLPIRLTPRGLRHVLQESRKDSLCLELPDSLKGTVAKVVHPQSGHVQSLNVTMAIDRKFRKGAAANSSVREALSEWLESPEGVAWKLERKQIFG